MKKTLILILFIASAVTANAQVTPNKDTPATFTPSDSTEFISVRDLSGYLEKLMDKVTATDYFKVRAAIQEAITYIIDEKRKKKPPVKAN